MKNFAKQFNLKFTEYKHSLQLEGMFRDKHVVIDESLDHIGVRDLNFNRKRLNILIDGKNIHRSASGIFFLPFTMRVKKILNDYIDKGIILKEKNYELGIIIIIFIISLLVIIYHLLA